MTRKYELRCCWRTDVLWVVVVDLLAAVLDVDSTSVDTDLPELGEMVGGGGGGAAAVLVAVVEGSLDLGGEAELQPPHSLFQQVPFAETKHRTRTGYLTIIIIETSVAGLTLYSFSYSCFSYR